MSFSFKNGFEDGRKGRPCDPTRVEVLKVNADGTKLVRETWDSFYEEEYRQGQRSKLFDSIGKEPLFIKSARSCPHCGKEL